MRVLHRKFHLIAVFLLILANPCWAEFTCRAEVQYSWRTDSGPVQSNKATTTSDPAATPGASKESGEQTVFWAVVERKGATEEEAKKLLSDAALQQRSGADKSCKQQHENLATCIANKFSALSATLNSLTFSARRSLEDAVTTDCQKQQGVCISSTVSNPACVEKKAEEAKPEGGEKDKGKKDKKK